MEGSGGRPPRTSSLQPPQADTQGASPRPDPLSIPAHDGTDSLSSHDFVDDQPCITARPAPESEDSLPSYDQTRRSEPNNPRFGRWNDWIEKRAAERRHERQESRQEGTLEPTSWGLPDDSSPAATILDPSHAPFDSQELAVARQRDQLQEERMSSNRYSVTNPDSMLRPAPAGSTSTERRSRSSSAASSPGTGAAGVSRLTTHISLEHLGSRFDRGLPEEPLCSTMLPTRAPARNQVEPDRFLLLGTAQALYVADLEPALSTNGPLHPPPIASARPHLRILPLWHGLGVQQVDCFVDSPVPGSEGARGLVVMVVGGEAGGVEIRMWSLTAIINIVKWRIYTESSVPLNLAVPSSPSSSSSHARNASLTTIKSLLATTSPKGKGKHVSAESPNRDQLESRLRSTSNATTELDSLPREWVSSAITLPLPKTATAVLFFKLARIPRAISEPFGEARDSDESSEDEDWTNEELRQRKKRLEERSKLFLLVATKGVVYVFESSFQNQRAWKLTRELTAPATPRFMQLVRSPKPSGDAVQASLHPPRQALGQSTRSTTTTYPSDLCLLLGTSHRTVLVRLDDCSVVELSLPTPSPAVAPTGLSRPRSRSLTNSISSTSSSNGHRSTASFSSSFKDNAIVRKVQQAIESKNLGSVPAGVRGERNIALGKKVHDSNGSTEDLNRTAPRDEVARWTASQELFIKTEHHRRSFQVLTRGLFTHICSNPLESCANLASHSTETMIALNPVFTFKWPARVYKVELILTPRSHESHLALIAFTSTGICVQEGFVPHETVFDPNSSRPFFIPTPAFSPTAGSSPLATLNRPSVEDVDELDLTASASLDFGAETGPLCESHQLVSGSSKGSRYLYTRSNADFVLKRIVSKLL
ncbi:uncharacterized protein JCM15063_002626 [Sporobolomyces koalae]|uniref:uncharacterized protein n=1 Tax=Sporobolomyces koalae TaxID=500713 RepID=UPI00316EF702